MPNPTIVHFEIPADDVQRAIGFYAKAFGWKISDPWNMGYFFVETRKEGKPGINGGLMQRNMPGQPFMNYLDVPDIDAMMAKIIAAGGTVAFPKMAIGQNMGWVAGFKDTEGNILGLHQSSPQALKAMRAMQKNAAKKRPRKKPPAKKVAKKPAKKTAGKKARRR